MTYETTWCITLVTGRSCGGWREWTGYQPSYICFLCNTEGQKEREREREIERERERERGRELCLFVA